MLSVFFFVLGAVVASFVGVIAARLHTGQSFLKGRSRCDACTAVLKPLSLVPVLSYIASRGRALCCGASVSVLSPLTELLLGGLFVFSFMRLGFSFALVSMLISLSLMLVLVLYDLAHQILPPVPLGLFVGTSLLTGFLSSPTTFLSTAGIAILLALGIASLHFFSRGRAMGLADAPFTLGCALLVGSSALAGFIFSFWIGAVIGIAILLRRPRGSRTRVEVPFAPFLAAGFLLAYFTHWDPFLLALFFSQ